MTRHKSSDYLEPTRHGLCSRDSSSRSAESTSMTRPGPTFVFAAVLGIASLGSAVSGCSNKSGKSVGPNQTANLTIESRASKTLHVYVDSVEIGEVLPATTGRFYVSPGYRSLAYRERGDSALEHQGNYDFTSTGTIELTYDPYDAFTLEVINNAPVTLHVIVDNLELGTVPPGTSGQLEAAPGRRDLYLRERGDPTADYLGTFNFTKGEQVSVAYP